jgi:predicted dehydrogenase
MQDKIRVAVVGTGGIARGHVRNFLEIPEVELVAFTDVSEARIAAIKEQFPAAQNVPEFSDYKEMLKQVHLDAVQISTPHTLHFDQAMDCFDAGLHVLLEKPMVCTVEHAKALIAKAEAKERVLMLSYQRHFSPQYRYFKKVLESGELGDVTFVSALQCQAWLTGVAGTWRQDPALSGGGQLNDSGSHLIDMLLWLTGLSARSVSAYIDNRGALVDINSTLAIDFEGGAKGSIAVVGDSVCGWHEDFTVWGTKGVLFYRNGKVMHCKEDGKTVDVAQEELPEGGNHDKGFIDAIQGRDKNWVPGLCGLRVIELTEAAWKSAAQGGAPSAVVRS